MRTKSFWHIVYSRTVEDTAITKLYRKYVSDELPEPIWWWSGEYNNSHAGIVGLLVRENHSHGLGDRLRWDSMNEFVRQLRFREREDFVPPPEVIGMVLTNYFSILSREGDQLQLAREAERYLSGVTWVLGPDTTLDDIPTPDEFGEWQEERNARVREQ